MQAVTEMIYEAMSRLFPVTNATVKNGDFYSGAHNLRFNPVKSSFVRFDMGNVSDYIGALYEMAWCPSWSKGVVCKTIIRRFESDPRLYFDN